MYLICKVRNQGYATADVVPIAFAYDAETAQRLAEEIGGVTIVLDSSFRVSLEAAIFRTKQAA